MLVVPDPALAYGFVNSPVGTHGSRTIMLSELTMLLAACPANATLPEYRIAILNDNVLLKKTNATRRESFRRLRELYALGRPTLIFRSLRDLWAADAESQPLLALLSSAARDPILRATAPLIMSLSRGASVTPQIISEAANHSLPGRYNSMTLANIGRHAASSWEQSGHLVGRANKTRAAAHSTPASTAYALLLGHLCGERGAGLFRSFWCHLLDAPEQVLHSYAMSAARNGWIEYKHSGNVTEVGFHFLLREADQDGG